MSLQKIVDSGVNLHKGIAMGEDAGYDSGASPMTPAKSKKSPANNNDAATEASEPAGEKPTPGDAY